MGRTDEGHDIMHRFLRRPYVDQSEGAFSPVRFIADNSTLNSGESTYGWRQLERVFFYDNQTPSGAMGHTGCTCLSKDLALFFLHLSSRERRQ